MIAPSDYIIVVRSPLGVINRSYSGDILAGQAHSLHLGTTNGLANIFVSPISIFNDDIEAHVSGWGDCGDLLFTSDDALTKMNLIPGEFIQLYVKGDPLINTGQSSSVFYPYYAGYVHEPSPPALLNRDSQPKEYKISGLKDLVYYMDTGINKSYGGFKGLLCGADLAVIATAIINQVLALDWNPLILKPPVLTVTTVNCEGTAINLPSYFPLVGSNASSNINTGSVDLGQILDKIKQLAADNGILIEWGVNAYRRIFFKNILATATTTDIDENIDGADVVGEKPNMDNLVNRVRWHLATANMRGNFVTRADYPPDHQVFEQSTPDSLTYLASTVGSTYAQLGSVNHKTASLVVDNNLNPFKQIAGDEFDWYLYQGFLEESYSGGVADATPNVERVYDLDPTSFVVLTGNPWNPNAGGYSSDGEFRIVANVRFDSDTPYLASDIVAMRIEYKLDDASVDVEKSESLMRFDRDTFDNRGQKQIRDVHFFHAVKLPADYGPILFPRWSDLADGFPDVDEFLVTGDRRLDNSDYDPLTDIPLLNDDGWTFYLTMVNKNRPIPSESGLLFPGPTHDDAGNEVVSPRVAVQNLTFYTIDKELLDKAAIDQFGSIEINSLTAKLPGSYFPTQRARVKLRGSTTWQLNDLQTTQFKIVFSREEGVNTYISVGNEMNSIYDQAANGSLQIPDNKLETGVRANKRIRRASFTPLKQSTSRGGGKIRG